MITDVKVVIITKDDLSDKFENRVQLFNAEVLEASINADLVIVIDDFGNNTILKNKYGKTTTVKPVPIESMIVNPIINRSNEY